VVGGGAINPKWVHFGTTGSATANSDGTNVPSSSFNLTYQGESTIPTMTMFCRAPAGMVNHSNNPTYFTYGQTSSLPITSSDSYREPWNRTIKNTVTSSYAGATGSFAKQTFISKVAIYDEEMNVVAIAKPAYPLRKREKDDLTLKIKWDL
jgi:hypothetical protein